MSALPIPVATRNARSASVSVVVPLAAINKAVETQPATNSVREATRVDSRENASAPSR